MPASNSSETQRASITCVCGCGNVATLNVGDDFYARPSCRQRFYRRTIRDARLGNQHASAEVRVRGWNIEANIGGGVRVRASGVVRRVRRVRRARRFGVEIEFSGNQSVTSRVVREAAALGLVIQIESYNHAVREHWKIVNDGSCGFELVSPPLNAEDGFEQIKNACRALRRAGASVNSRCGLHVHIESRDVTVDAVKNVVRFYSENQTIINGILSRSRHNSNYAGSWQRRELDAIAPLQTIEEITRAAGTRYKTVNVSSFPRYGTLEFRQHQGTLNAEKISNWVRFCVALLNASVSGLNGNRSTIQALVNAIGLDTETRSYFEERAMELA